MTKNPVVIITGVSSGIGLASAQLFTKRGWIVVGTVRTKQYPAELSTAGVDVQLAEMTSPRDIARVVELAYKTYGHIDAVVANAGYGLLGGFESLTHEQLVDQLAVNTVAVADLVREALPIMRQQKGGVVAAVSSVGGRIGLPGYSLYNASKFALEGMFESLAYELADSDIRVKLIEPSTVKTPFWNRSDITKPTSGLAEELVAKTIRRGHSGGLTSERVAMKIFQAVKSSNNKLHYPVGLTLPIVILRRLLPDQIFYKLVWRFL